MLLGCWLLVGSSESLLPLACGEVWLASKLSECWPMEAFEASKQVSESCINRRQHVVVAAVALVLDLAEIGFPLAVSRRELRVVWIGARQERQSGCFIHLYLRSAATS